MKANHQNHLFLVLTFNGKLKAHTEPHTWAWQEQMPKSGIITTVEQLIWLFIGLIQIQSSSRQQRDTNSPFVQELPHAGGSCVCYRGTFHELVSGETRVSRHFRILYIIQELTLRWGVRRVMAMGKQVWQNGRKLLQNESRDLVVLSLLTSWDFTNKNLL